MQKIRIFLIAMALSAALPQWAPAQAVDCSGSNCDGPVQIPANDESKGVVVPDGEGMKPAGEAGMAPGEPIEAPAIPNRDPIAPNEPPPPGQ